MNVSLPKRFSTASQPQTAARHGDRQNAARRHAGTRAPVLGIPVVAERVELLDRGAGRRHAAGIQHIDLVFLGDIDDGEQIAGDADIHGLDHIEHRGRRHGRIDGVAAVLQHLQARLRGQRLTGRDHAVLRHDFGAALRRPAFGAIAADRAAKGGLRRGFAALHLRRLCKCRTEWNTEHQGNGINGFLHWQPGCRANF